MGCSSYNFFLFTTAIFTLGMYFNKQRYRQELASELESFRSLQIMLTTPSVSIDSTVTIFIISVILSTFGISINHVPNAFHCNWVSYQYTDWHLPPLNLLNVVITPAIKPSLNTGLVITGILFAGGENSNCISFNVIGVFMACGVGDIENENLNIIFLVIVVITMVLWLWWSQYFDISND